MSVFMADTRNAADPQAGSSRADWTDLVQEFLAERRVESQQEVADESRSVRGGRRVGFGHSVENQAMNGPLAEVFGDLRAGVVGTERLLVDVLLEDVA